MWLDEMRSELGLVDYDGTWEMVGQGSRRGCRFVVSMSLFTTTHLAAGIT
jgi:hypothetical protein